MRSDVIYALRSFLRQPGFTAVCILTLALGIGANTAIFSIVHAVLLRPLAYDQPDRILRVQRGTSFPDMRDWIEQTRSFSAIGGFRPQAFDYSDGSAAQRLDGALVTGDLLKVLGAQLQAGRTIVESDDRTGGGRIVLISAAFWRNQLGRRADTLGSALQLNGATYTIVGVLDEEFSLPGLAADVIAPFHPEAGREAESRGAHTLRALVRLRDGVTREQAQEEMNLLAGRLEQQFPVSNTGVRFTLQPLADSLTGQIRPALSLLLATVVFVLLIACVNVANLLIARGAARHGELAVRVALGAGRARIARQLITESLLLALAGGGCGVAVAYWTLEAVIALAPAGVPRLTEAALNPQVLAFTAGSSIAAGLLFGLVPAWTSSIREIGRASTRATARGSRARSILMVAEIALALVLVAGAGLLVRSFYLLTRQPLGFNPSGLVTANVTFNSRRALDIRLRTASLAAFEESIRAIPGVTSVAMTTDLPIGGTPIFHNLAFEGRPLAAGTEPEVYYRGINTTYFEALGIPLVRGRVFTSSDRAGAPPVAIVNEAFVREYYPGQDPIGRRIRWASGNGEWITIVGVAADVRGLALDTSEVPAVHVPYLQERMPWRTWMDVAVRTNATAVSIGTELREALARVDNTVPLMRVSTMSDVVGRSVSARRFNLYLLGAFAAISLILAAAGTYGVMAFMVTQRTSELGIRIALGARPADICSLVVGRGIVLALCGIGVGLTVAIVSAWLWHAYVSSFLFQTEPADATAMAGAAVVLLAAATLASYIPARRAARLDPLTALRRE